MPAGHPPRVRFLPVFFSYLGVDIHHKCGVTTSISPKSYGTRRKIFQTWEAMFFFYSEFSKTNVFVDNPEYSTAIKSTVRYRTVPGTVL